MVDGNHPRLEYTLDFIFKEREFDYQLLLDNRAGVKIDFAYMNSDRSDLICFTSSSVLFSNAIYRSAPIWEEKENCLSFDGVCDPFASIFYVLTRMEEYAVEKKDSHGRFPLVQSILSDQFRIEKAWCDRWAVSILSKIGMVVPEPSAPTIVPTFDIDNTYAYKYKSGLRRQLSILKDRLKGNAFRIHERKRVEKGGKDPYDTFDLIRDTAQRFKQTQIFWLVRSHGKFDRNLSIQVSEHRNLIKSMSDVASVNIHPSYASLLNSTEVTQEKKDLEAILGKPISASRQHFLRMQLPKSYRVLLHSGILHDYTMGFAEHVGFRCGTARTHFWFDLEKNERTELQIHPFVYMDGTLNEYMQLSAAEAKEKIQQLYEEVTRYGGDFCFLWHNETIGNYGIWLGWQSVLEFTLNLEDEKE